MPFNRLFNHSVNWVNLLKRVECIMLSKFFRGLQCEILAIADQ